MIAITKLEGKDERLYSLVGPLVMDTEILKQNNNFPFRTSEKHVWYVAVDDNRVTGFMPVEKKRSGLVVNNYYVEDRKSPVLKSLLKRIVKDAPDRVSLYAVAMLNDAGTFEEEGFDVVKKWTRYVRMMKPGKKKETA